MDTVFADLVKVSTSTTGTSDIAVGAAAAGYLTPAQAGVTNGAQVTYELVDGGNREVGHGVYSSTGPTITRATVITSTNSGSKISLSGSATMILTVASADLNALGSSLLPGGGSDGQVVGRVSGSPAWVNPAVSAQSGVDVGKMLVVQSDGSVAAISDADITGSGNYTNWRVLLTRPMNLSTTIYEVEFRAVAGVSQSSTGGTVLYPGSGWWDNPDPVCFDGNTATGARPYASPAQSYIGYAHPTARTVREVAIYVSGTDITQLNIQYYNGTTWVDAVVVTGITWHSGAWNYFAVPFGQSGARIHLGNARDYAFLGPVTVSALPAASSVTAGSRGFVTDANSTTFLSTVAGGGSNKVPVVSDGTNWVIG